MAPVSPMTQNNIFLTGFTAGMSLAHKKNISVSAFCIAREIVTAHHGSILVGDTPGGGATFTVFLKR